MLNEALHEAAAREDLLARGADPTCTRADGRTAAQRVPGGDPSCDPQDVVAWRHLRRTLERAAARVDAVELSAPDEVVAGPLQVWIARAAPSPVDHGGGELRAVASLLAPGRLLVRLDGGVHGALPSADPPWTLRAVVEVTVDEDGHVLSEQRRSWTHT
ncbi:MAG: hypothetical protein R3A48_01605 [Polyangiales bacterium]